MDQCGCTESASEWKGNWDPFVRLCYQFGMLLGVDEFGQEQGYHIGKHRLSQRLFVGYGLVWGGDVHVDADASGRQILTIEPFFAVDELGRELWSKEACRIDLGQWAEEQGVEDDTPVYVTIGYRSCCVAPVPAVAAPCDDAASPTMPSRAVEAVECALVLDPPEPPIDLSSAIGADASTQASRFEILVALIRDDAPRPLLLAAFTRETREVGPRWTPIAGATAPVLAAPATSGLRVTSASLDEDVLVVDFNVPPVFAPVAAFHVERVIVPAKAPGGGGASATSDAKPVTKPVSGPIVPSKPQGTGVGALEELVDPSANIEVDGARLRIALVDTPQSGQAYRIRVEGTGPNGVLALGNLGLIPLGGGADFTLYARS